MKGHPAAHAEVSQGPFHARCNRDVSFEEEPFDELFFAEHIFHFSVSRNREGTFEKVDWLVRFRGVSFLLCLPHSFQSLMFFLQVSAHYFTQK